MPLLVRCSLDNTMSEEGSQSSTNTFMKQRRFAAAANRTGKKHPGKAILAGTLASSSYCTGLIMDI